MAHYGSLRDFAFSNEVDIDDIRGSAVYGVDNDKLGKIDDVIFNHVTGDLRYVVIDTGGWLTSKKFLVPADRIHDYEKDKDAFQVDLTKEHIEKKFPRYDEDKMKSQADWKDYEDRYQESWDEDPVQHREGRLDLNVTPADVTGVQPREVRAQRDVNVAMGSMGEEVTDITDISDSAPRAEEDIAGDLTPQRLAGKFPAPIQGSHKISMSPSHVEERDYDQARVGQDRVPDRAWEDNATGSSGRGREVPNRDDHTIAEAEKIDRETNLDRDRRERSEIHRAGTGEWHPRMKRFEDVLRKNRVDVTASCASCAAAKEDKAA